MSSSAFIYDFLIAGNFPLVTDRGLVLTDQGVLTRGTALGRIAGSLGAAVADGAGTAGANTGNGTISAVSLGSSAIPGSYVIKMTSATTFSVTSPAGVSLPSGVVGTAYVSTQIAFTIAAGATAFVAGDGFSIPVAAGSNKLKICNSANTDGSGMVYAILAETADTTSGDVEAAIYKSGEFNIADVPFGGTDTPTAHMEEARHLGIYFKAIHPEAS
jgi:hypothetical protein